MFNVAANQSDGKRTCEQKQTHLSTDVTERYSFSFVILAFVIETD